MPSNSKAKGVSRGDEEKPELFCEFLTVLWGADRGEVVFLAMVFIRGNEKGLTDTMRAWAMLFKMKHSINNISGEQYFYKLIKFVNLTVCQK
jgi:hypothetical protein